jgi:hypothetical protein
MSRIIAIAVMNSVLTKVIAKHDILFNKPSSEMGLLNIQVQLKERNKA